MGGWVKPQLGLFFVVEILCFFVKYVSKKNENWRGGGWVVSGQSEFFSDFFNFLNMTKPLIKYRWWKVYVSAMGTTCL